MRANKAYSEAKRQFNVSNRDVLIGMHSSLISGGPLLSLLCSVRVRHCHRLLVLVVDWCASLLVYKVDLLSDNLDGKQSRESVDLPLTCRPSPCLINFAFRWSEVRLLLLDLDPYGGTDKLFIFPLFLKRTDDVVPSS